MSGFVLGITVKRHHQCPADQSAPVRDHQTVLINPDQPLRLKFHVEFEAQGLVRVDQHRLVITDRGRLVSRALVMPFDRYTQNEARHRFSRII